MNHINLDLLNQRISLVVHLLLTLLLHRYLLGSTRDGVILRRELLCLHWWDDLQIGIGE